jgi:hypothetical protein
MRNVVAVTGDLLQKRTVICYIETAKSRIAGTGLAALERTTSNETNTVCDLRAGFYR